MINNLYTYKAILNKVVDGDTLNLTIDLGFNTFWKSNCRLAGINTPELKAIDEATKKKAYNAKAYVISQLLPEKHSEILIVSRELNKYGRPIADIYYGHNFSSHLNKELIDKGYAVKYM
jgi:micrococcal nuclease